MKISSIIALLALTLSFGVSACWPSGYNFHLSNFVNVADIYLVLTYLTAGVLFLTLKRKKSGIEYAAYLSLLAISLLIQHMGLLSASLDDCSMSIDNSLLTKSLVAWIIWCRALISVGSLIKEHLQERKFKGEV